MEMYVYSILDKKSSKYGAPFFKPHDAIAVRESHSIVNGPHAGMIKEYPEDFDLYKISEIDNE